MKSFSHTLNRTLLLTLFLSLVSFFGWWQTAAAQAPFLALTVNGGDSASVVNGQPVLLEWYIEGDLASCTLTDGSTILQNIDTSSLPATPIVGSMTYIPPEGSETQFVLNCDGVVDAVAAMMQPVITMSIDGGSPQTLDPSTGRINYLRVRWNSTYATRCGVPEFESANYPRQFVSTNGQDVSNLYQPSGWVAFDGWPRPYIRENTTFYITCINEATGAQTTASTSLDILFPPPPSPIAVAIWADEYTITPDPLLGYARTGVHTRSWNGTSCNYNAYLLDGVTPTSLPGYGHWSGHANGDFTPYFSTSTVLELVCSRGAVTIGTTTYPAVSTSSRITVYLSNDPFQVDRTALPPVTVTVTPVPTTSTSTILDPYSGRGSMTFNITAANADYCYLRAYANPDDTNEYDLSGWSRVHSWNRISGNFSGTITTNNQQIDTSYFVECIRAFDVDNYPVGTVERTNGYASTSVWITAEPYPGNVPDPEVFIYANPLKYDAENMLANATENTGFYSSTAATTFFGNQTYMRTDFASVSPSPKRITFPFPYANGSYNVHFAHCDEADGDSNVSLYVNGAPFGSYVMDNPDGSWSGCGTIEYFFGFLGGSVPINFGDSITIECTPDVDLALDPNGEGCRIESLIFATPGTVVAQRAAGQATVDVQILYDSTYATHCRSYDATTAGGNTYTWSFDDRRDLVEFETISTSTNFSVECYRDADSAFADNTLQILMPATTTLTDAVVAAAGECLSGGVMISAPPGYMADPGTGACVPAADLSLAAPADSNSGGTNNVDGTYDLIEALIVIENLGPGALATTSGDISYMATLAYMPGYTLRYGPTGQSSSIGGYGAGLAAPASVLSPTQSSTLTRDLEDVPFGTHTLCGRVNLDYGTNLPEPDLDGDGNQDLANNEVCSTITLPVPEPPMNLVAEPVIVRAGQSTDLSWDINVTYQMDCTLIGPGGLNEVFNTADTGPAYSDSATVGPLGATSEFIFQCTEDLTNTTFTRTVTVEVVPAFQEI